MKKYVTGMMAVALALGVSAFTGKNLSKEAEVYNWNHYTGSTSSPTVTQVQLTQEEAEAMSCPGSQFKCLVKLDDQLRETSEIIERGAQ